MELLEIIICIFIAILTMAVGFFVGITYRKRIAEAKIGSAEQQADRIIEDAVKQGEQKKKEALRTSLLVKECIFLFLLDEFPDLTVLFPPYSGSVHSEKAFFCPTQKSWWSSPPTHP